jgi:uncharacterized protein
MTYSYIIIPIIVVVSSQVLKLLTDSVRGNFTFKDMFISYGGFPSAHTAFAVSATTLLGLRLGFDSPMFALSLVFTLLVMRDALAFRNIIGHQAKLLNRLRALLPGQQTADIPPLRERMGHSGAEVAAGAVWGALLTYFLNLF